MDEGFKLTQFQVDARDSITFKKNAVFIQVIQKLRIEYSKQDSIGKKVLLAFTILGLESRV